MAHALWLEPALVIAHDLAAFWTGFRSGGISGVLCRTMNMLVVMVALFTLLMAHLSVIVTF